MKKRLCGGYIQLWPNNGLINDDIWREVLLEMKELGMDTAIIQFMDTADSIKLDESTLIAEIILRYAQQNHIKVFLGLYGPPRRELGHPSSVEPDKLNISKSESIRVANKLKVKFIGAKAFYGWHLPLESWTENYPSATITGLNEYYKSLTTALKALLPDKKVLISPFINAGRDEPSTVQKAYTEILHDTEIDFLALQDGVGAGYISVDDPELPAYFAAICAACNENHIEMWANVESFVKNTAAESARFIKQLKQAQGSKRIVTFDFFHYMNSRSILLGSAKPPSYQDDVESLNRKYRAWLQQEQTAIAGKSCYF